MVVLLILEDISTGKMLKEQVLPTNRAKDNYLEVASQMWCDSRDRQNAGASSYKNKESGELYINGSYFGKVSYNGKIWENGETKSINPIDYRVAFEKIKRAYIPNYSPKSVKKYGKRTRLRGDIFLYTDTNNKPIGEDINRTIYKLDRDGGLYNMVDENLKLYPLANLDSQYRDVYINAIRSGHMKIPIKPTYEHSLVVQSVSLTDGSFEYISVYGIVPSHEREKSYAASRRELYSIITKVDKNSTIGNFRGEVSKLKYALSQRGLLWSSSKENSLKVKNTMGGFIDTEDLLEVDCHVIKMRKIFNDFIERRPAQREPYSMQDIIKLLESEYIPVKLISKSVPEPLPSVKIKPTQVELSQPHKFGMFEVVYFIDGSRILKGEIVGIRAEDNSLSDPYSFRYNIKGFLSQKISFDRDVYEALVFKTKEELLADLASSVE